MSDEAHTTTYTIASILAGFGTTEGIAIALGAITTAVSIAVYITRMGSQNKIDGLQSELQKLQAAKTEDLRKAEERYLELEARYRSIIERGAQLQSELDKIVQETDEIATQIGASRYSVLAPAPTSIPGDVPDQLVFLIASGPQSATLQTIRVPIASSLADEAFKSGQATIGIPKAASFSSATDKVTTFKTDEALSVCLRYKSQRVGVAQFLNKTTGNFTAEDKERALRLCATLAVRVADFVLDPRKLVELGHAPRQNQFRATIMFIDLSNYSNLFDQLDGSIVTDILNQYFQELCTIAFRQGAVVDQILGDGLMLIFNIDQNQDGHETVALSAALEMRTAFRALRRRWVGIRYDGADKLYVRFGIASGSVNRVELGHPQSRRTTVIGRAVNAAGHACKCAPRDHDTICITEDLKDALTMEFPTRPLHAEGVTYFQDADG